MLIIKHLQMGGGVTPNICYVEETNGIVVKPYIKPEKIKNQLDILYVGDDSFEVESKVKMVFEYPVESDIVINATHAVPNIVNGKPQGTKDVVETFHVTKGNTLSDESWVGLCEWYNVVINPSEDEKYIYCGF